MVELARDPAVQRGRIFYFSGKQALEPKIMNIGGAVQIENELKVRIGLDIRTYTLKGVQFLGEHMVENFMSAILVAEENGAQQSDIQKVLMTFKGLPHRLEYVRKVGGVKFYNDSKATNVHAVMRALSAFDEGNIILIAGGKDTNLNYEPLKKLIKNKVKTLILVGEAKERMNRVIGDFSNTYLIGTFKEAVFSAYQKSRIGDIVLLSPGCSSFDQFDNYVERGNTFKQIINQFNLATASLASIGDPSATAFALSKVSELQVALQRKSKEASALANTIEQLTAEKARKEKPSKLDAILEIMKSTRDISSFGLQPRYIPSPINF